MTVLTKPAEQLCASGTVGIAAIGFAFGHPQQRTIATRPSTTRRKPMVRGVLDESQTASINSPQPSSLPSSASASTSRLRKRSSLGQPLSPSNRFSEGAYSTASTQGGRIHEEADCTDPSSSALKRSSSPGPSALELKGTGTAKSSWLRRMSTLSSLKPGNHDSTPPPGSPSLSYSNGSTALILPSTANEGPLVSPRNKLVKRTSSQKILSGTSTPHSTLRRPATSHQRTLQQRYSSGEEHNYRSRFAHSVPFDDLREDHHAYDDSLETWVPFFTTQAPASTKDGFTRKRNSNSGANWKEPIGSRIPNANGPTLLLATSISPGLSNDVLEDSIPGPQLSSRRRPSTAIGFQTFIPPSKPNAEVEPSSKQDPNSRRSFSIADMFPSPSPSTWKIPRSASLRKNRGPSSVPNGRRVSSAPLATNSSRSPSASATEAENLNPLKTRTLVRSRGDASGGTSSPLDELENPSSPLPPLNRISTFEIDLPTTAPLYPASPPSRVPSASPRMSSAPSPLISSPPGLAGARNKSHRPSGAPSDRASTLLGSDNDNSRFLPSDEDEFDFRSDTVYDSTRTGATGSSHSGVRRPPIETIFDESPPESSKHKLITLQDLLSNQSFVESNADTRRNAEADHGLSTPALPVAPCKEEEYPTPIHATNEPRLTDFPPSSPDIPLELGSDRPMNHHMDEFRDDEDWFFENAEEMNHALPRYRLSSNNDQSSPLGTSPRYSLGLQNSGLAAESSPKANIFEWSEQSMADKESLQGSSPRPKTVHGIKAKETRTSRLSGRRGSSALHLRSQSVPVPQDGSGHRSHNSTSKLESWVLGNKGVSEDWDGDFDFDETHQPSKHAASRNDAIRSSSSSGMLVPRAILERQASVRGQFGQVKELTLLVEELKRLRQQASVQGIMQGQSAELWKEAEGIINLATLDDDEEQEFLPPRSPLATGSDLDAFDEDSPSSRRKSGHPGRPSREDRSANVDDSPSFQISPRSSSVGPKLDTPPSSRPRKESAAKAKSVLETIHQQRSEYGSTFIDAKSSQKNFDTTSLRDLVTRAGVVTRALKEIVRRAENSPPASKPRPTTPQDPLFSQIFQQQAPSSPSISKTPRVTQSPKSNNFRGGAIAGNDNEINGHMKMMTVV